MGLNMTLLFPTATSGCQQQEEGETSITQVLQEDEDQKEVCYNLSEEKKQEGILWGNAQDLSCEQRKHSTFTHVSTGHRKRSSRLVI